MKNQLTQPAKSHTISMTKITKAPMTPLLSSAFVIFREGFEVWLIMVLALASTNGNLQQQKSIWISAVTAFAATILLGSATAAWLGNHANLERFEALIAIITGVILAWVAWFCHGAAQHVKHLPLHNAWLLGLAVFGIVFREGVEVVVFLTGIIIDSQDVYSAGLGILVGLAILVMVMMVSNHQIKKLPVRLVFRISRWIFCALAVYFLYNGIHEIIEYGLY
jgi:FTR1 family protein